MNSYITGNTVKNLREKKKMTQKELGEQLGVSDKTISKWETGKGYPDISLLEPLASALSISVVELLSGECVTNRNTSSNMMRSHFYVCPICQNVIHSMGEGVISCCGITLPALDAEEPDEMHSLHMEKIDHEYYLSIDHEMTKSHYISFLAYVTTNKSEIIKLYPEGNAETRVLVKGHGMIYWYCNRHGLMKKRI